MSHNNIRYWFVGAMWGGGDKTQEFIEQGIWQNGYHDKYIDKVKSISVGDFIAIKSSYTKRKDLPFKNDLNSMASVMKIKAIGKVIDNSGDGRTLKVKWETFEEKEWYFFTGRLTVWEVKPTTWIRKALIDFTFNNGKQDYDKFRNDPFWKDRFGDKDKIDNHFKWTSFYQEFADKLLLFKNKRTELVNKLHSLSKELDSFAPLNDHYKGGGLGPVKDICPFTVIAIFNRGITVDKRVLIAKELASFLGVETEVPTEFESIPVVNNQKTWFFGYEDKREDDDIDTLWEMFEQGLKLADTQSENYDSFITQYDDVNSVRNVAWNITQGLYWIRPWDFPTLDSRSRDYIKKDLGINIKSNGIGNRCSGEDYLELCEELELLFEDENCPINSYPELSLAAWNKTSTAQNKDDGTAIEISLLPQNIILYGPPGTGKTYNCINKSLGIVLGDGNIPVERIDQKRSYQELVNKKQIVFTTFHQSLSYEDFIEGIKPKVEGDNVIYKVVDGIFKDIAQSAEENWSKSQDIEEVTFYSLWDKLIEPFKDEDSEQVELVIKTPRGQFKIYDVDEKTIRFEKANGSRIHTLCIKSLHKYYIDPSLIKDLGGLRTYYQSLINHLKDMKGDFKSTKEELKQYVLIIDEINRGNVASIFGELITLLEPDKRSGMKEALSVKLPYSGDDFSVPPNLHIIGTMNTADRSVEALDVALRRRFCFEELMPKPVLLSEIEFDNLNMDIDLSLMLETINNRIMRLKDRDHSIGHSYFYSLLNCSDTDLELRYIFGNKIIPLLEEYFYGDWEKIGMVLGESFVSKSSSNITFGKGFTDSGDYDEVVYTISNQNNWNFKSIYE